MAEPVFDEVTGHYYGLTDAQVRAMAALPVRVGSRGAPPLGTIRALVDRGMVERCDGRDLGGTWARTALGERIWGLLR